MKKNISYHIWGILNPIGLYYVISSMAYFGLTILFGESNEVYMLKQALCSAAAIPFLLSIWKQDMYAENIVYGKQKQPASHLIIVGILICIAMAAFGIALNNFIVIMNFTELSVGFQQANEAFFGGGILVEILASCIVVPIAEEILFRGIVLKRCGTLVGERWGIFFSALLFGIIHVNIVQFLYAFLLGLVLAEFVLKTRRVTMAVLGHAAVNFVAVLRAETGILDFSYQPDFAGIAFSCIMLLIGGTAATACFQYIQKSAQNKIS